MFRTNMGYLLILLLALPAMASTKKTIFWQTYHRPPTTFNHGEHKGQGFMQKSLQLIIDKMPEYQHEMPVTTLTRAISNLKAGQNVCHPALHITAERKKYMLFSNASTLNPTNRVIAKKSTITPFLDNNQVNLDKVLKEGTLTLGYVKSRSYGSFIDDAFKRHDKTRSFIPVENIDLARIFKMIERGRVDLSIAYPFEVRHYLKNHPQAIEHLAIYPIANVPPYDVGYIACPKNAWGQKVIQKINIVLKELKPTFAYQNALTTWRESERESVLFQEYYKHYFLPR